MRTLVALGLAAFLGCARPRDPWETRGDRVLGIGSERAADPVSGAIVLKRDAVRWEYRGTTYYFESSDTAATFMEHPAEYAIPGEGREGRIDIR